MITFTWIIKSGRTQIAVTHIGNPLLPTPHLLIQTLVNTMEGFSKLSRKLSLKTGTHNNLWELRPS